MPETVLDRVVDPSIYTSPESYWLAKWYSLPRSEREKMHNLRSDAWTRDAMDEWEAVHHA